MYRRCSQLLIQLLLFIFLESSVSVGIAQERLDTHFLEHLNDKKYYKELIFLVDDNTFRNDSVYYYAGWAHYSLKQLQQSTHYFKQVSTRSPFYYKSQFFAGYNSTFLSDYATATTQLKSIHSEKKAINDLKDFQLAGIDLLRRDYSAANQRWKKIETNHPAWQQPLNELQTISLDLQKHRAKSPVLAGILSAIIPGAGKIYAGKKGQGVASFIGTVGLGLITWENYRKLGPTHFKTLAFGTLFTANYASTIYGSVITCKQVENEYQSVIQNQVLFNLHIPLRNFFDQ